MAQRMTENLKKNQAAHAVSLGGPAHTVSLGGPAHGV
jgi:hypothetical protein